MKLSTLRSTKMTISSTDTFCCPNMSTRRSLEGDSLLNTNGDQLECSNQEDGCTMKFTNLNLLFYFSEDQWVLIPILDWLLTDTHTLHSMLCKSTPKLFNEVWETLALEWEANLLEACDQDFIVLRCIMTSTGEDMLKSFAGDVYTYVD